jgi:hypothetical protein
VLFMLIISIQSVASHPVHLIPSLDLVREGALEVV